MFVYTDLQLELLKTQKALDMLKTVLSEAEFDSVCGSLVQHRDRISSRLKAAGWGVEPSPGSAPTGSGLLLGPGNRSHKKLLEAWANFISNGEVGRVVYPTIAASWKRCYARVNPIQAVSTVRLNPSHLLTSQVAGFDLISIARPIMEDIYQYIDKPGMVLMLMNSAGCMLDRMGEGEILNSLDAWGMMPGAILTEDLLGTNAVGLALTERVPVQVLGPEHYLQGLHGVAGAGAPIFDSSGHLLGVLGLLMKLEQYHVYSLGLVAATARAIESQHQADVLLAEQNVQMAQLNTILSTISDGLLVWNAEHVLLHANRAASKILDIPVEALVGREASTIFTFPAFIRDAVAQRKPLVDIEATITVGRRNVTCLMNADYVFTKQALQWVIVTLRTEKQVRSLVTQQVGASAPLTLDDIPGDSPQMQQVRMSVRSAAKARASVLIRGETGTGKNVLANAIHNISLRRENPFVIVACASIPNELMIRELFGFDELRDGRHMGSRPSKFELAQGGTLFLQDVDALPLEAQAVLMNAVESGVIQRVGSTRSIEIDVRVVASTAADIEKLVTQGSFRPDLYYWLSTFMVTLPPLRERRRDIPQVVERILKRLATQWGLPRLSLENGVLEVFKSYAWPGNTREVEAVLGRAAAQVGPGAVINMAALPAAVRFAAQMPVDAAGHAAVQPLIDLEREAILRTAQLCQGNVTLMAQTLEISRTTLWRRMREFGIQPKDHRVARLSGSVLRED